MSHFFNEYLVGFVTEMHELNSYSGALQHSTLAFIFFPLSLYSFCYFKNLVFYSEFIRFLHNFSYDFALKMLSSTHSVISFSAKISFEFYAIIFTAYVHGNPSMSYGIQNSLFKIKIEWLT